MKQYERKEAYTFEELREIIAKLRAKDGCPWDRAQTYESLKKCLAEETEEVFQAVDKEDRKNLCEELGDVLLLILLNSQIAEEEGAFTVDDVITGLCQKMIRRHPHVFGGEPAGTPEEALERWNEIKRQEKVGLIP